MTPEREGRGPRMDQAGPALRFEKGAKAEPAEPKARGRPAMEKGVGPHGGGVRRSAGGGSCA